MHAVKLSPKTQAILALNAHERETAWNAIASFQQGRTPDGTRDAQSCWHPVQRFACCAQVRSPTPEAPQSLFVHCSSLRHHEALHGAKHDAVLTVRRWLNENEWSLAWLDDEAQARARLDSLVATYGPPASVRKNPLRDQVRLWEAQIRAGAKSKADTVR